MPDVPGSLIIIGGHEDREGARAILRAVAARLGGKPLLLVTAASRTPEDYVQTYEAAFRELGVEVQPVDPQDFTPEQFERAGGLYISGGDQRRFMESTSSALRDCIRRLWSEGGVVAGTSAGASVLGELMLVSGPGETSPGEGDIELMPGLSLLPGCIVDQHFAERGRIGRLVASLTREPLLLGVGVDEDTAAIVEDGRLRVLGSGAVYVLKMQESEEPGVTPTGRPREFQMRVLAAGDSARLGSRRH